MFRDRIDAGRQLARQLAQMNLDGSVVLALPRGGAVIGGEVANELNGYLGLVFAQKISHPFFPELAVGAVVDHDLAIYSDTNNRSSPADKFWLNKAEANAQKLNAYRKQLYYDGEYYEPEIEGKTAIIVDDGIATGLTMKAAVQAVRDKQPRRIIVAAPLASAESISELRGLAEEVIVLYDPKHFKGSVGAHYLKFDQVDDEEVKRVIQGASRQQAFSEL